MWNVISVTNSHGIKMGVLKKGNIGYTAVMIEIKRKVVIYD
jgi:hypothetical protein